MRHPVITAKQATSVAYLTNNRFGFGVGLSPWPDDFRAVQVPWEGRGKRMDEAIEILRGLETGEYFEFHGDHYDIQPIKLCPAPTQRIPILIGGHADVALRRAARVGDGWMHAGLGDGHARRQGDRPRERAAGRVRPARRSPSSSTSSRWTPTRWTV